MLLHYLPTQFRLVVAIVHKKIFTNILNDFSVSVSAVEFLFATIIFMFKQEISWHRVCYYLAVRIILDFL